MGFIFGLICLSAQICNALGSRVFHGSVSGTRNYSSSFKKRFNYRAFVLIKLEFWAQYWACRSNSQSNAAELAWNFSCCLIRKVGGSGGCHGTVEFKSSHNSLTKLVTRHWNPATEKPNISPPQLYESRVIALTSLGPSRSHVIASTWWVLIPELLLQGNGKMFFSFLVSVLLECTLEGSWNGCWLLIHHFHLTAWRSKMCNRIGNPWVLFLFLMPFDFHLDKWIFFH